MSMDDDPWETFEDNFEIVAKKNSYSKKGLVFNAMMLNSLYGKMKCSIIL